MITEGVKLFIAQRLTVCKPIHVKYAATPACLNISH